MSRDASRTFAFNKMFLSMTLIASTTDDDLVRDYAVMTARGSRASLRDAVTDHLSKAAAPSFDRHYLGLCVLILASNDPLARNIALAALGIEQSQARAELANSPWAAAGGDRHLLRVLMADRVQHHPPADT